MPVPSYYDDEPVENIQSIPKDSGIMEPDKDVVNLDDNTIAVPHEFNTPAPKPLHDESRMPFGKHKGKRMQDVPAEYLHWFFTATVAYGASGRAVKDYIKHNLNALKEEYPDGIWKEK